MISLAPSWVVEVMCHLTISALSDATKYAVYSLYRGDDCAHFPCDEEYTCAHTCYFHGLECSTAGFDCHAEAVKFCEGKELVMLIESYCATDLCDVSASLSPAAAAAAVTAISCPHSFVSDTIEFPLIKLAECY